ncbi:DUF2249 domain-containing protein [Congregicoccus parvus]|uniref:DUF2249 domain-containing protein n=1 Tax=Congregicoccus parvus TaxID=3081749 RepID=UPI003FA5E6D6
MNSLSHESGPHPTHEITHEIDVRGLPPPEPMMRVLEAVAMLTAEDRLVAVTERRPLHLLAELDARGHRHRCEEMADGSWRTTITRSSSRERTCP